MTIHSAMIAVMRDAGAITKNRKNTTQNYSFRGIDDVYNELHDIMAKHGVFTTGKCIDHKREERRTIKEWQGKAKESLLLYSIVTMEYTFWAEDGSSVVTTVIGEGMDSGDKATNKAMAVAHKYALLQAFAIPTEDAKDPENDSPAPVPQPRPAQPPRTAPAQATQQAPAAPAKQDQPGVMTISGIIEDVLVAESNPDSKKKWKKIAAKIGGGYYSTFDKEIGQAISDCKGMSVDMRYTYDGKYNTVVDFSIKQEKNNEPPLPF